MEYTEDEYVGILSSEKSKFHFFIVFLVSLIDQISKIYIKTHFTLHEEYPVFPWFKILFTEWTDLMKKNIVILMDLSGVGVILKMMMLCTVM